MEPVEVAMPQSPYMTDYPSTEDAGETPELTTPSPFDGLDDDFSMEVTDIVERPDDQAVQPVTGRSSTDLGFLFRLIK